MNTMKIFFYSLIIVMLGACGYQPTKLYADGNEMAEELKAQVDWISAADFRTVLESNETFYLIDCRESEEFDLACIQGAMSVPRTVLEDEIANQVPGKRIPLYIYCANGRRSTLAATVLPLLKYTDVKVIEGGFDAWQETFPDLVEHNPVRGAVKKAVAAPSGGCGG